MMSELAVHSHHHKTRLRLQSEKSSAHSDAHPVSANHGDMQAISATVQNLLKYTGFQERALRNCFDYRLEKNDVYLPDLPAEFEGYTVLHLSDLHADGLVDSGEGIKRIVETVECDLAVFTGDYNFDETGAQYKTCLDVLAPIVNSIKVQDGIFGILGNHDLLEMVPGLERMGVRMLLNDAVRLQRGAADIVLAGVDDPHSYKCHDLKKALSVTDPNQCVVLLSHSPDIAPEASTCGVDLYLCGHTHGGQICLPGGIAMFVNSNCNRRYVSGSWKCDDMHGYTSRGAGFSCAAARFFCPPEITLHTLHSGNLPSKFFDAFEGNIGRFIKLAGQAIFS